MKLLAGYALRSRWLKALTAGDTMIKRKILNR
jgi:hypothetical protein